MSAPLSDFRGTVYEKNQYGMPLRESLMIIHSEKKFYIFYVLCVMLPLIVTDAVVLSIVNNAEKRKQQT